MTTDNQKSLKCSDQSCLKKPSTWYLYIVQTRYGHWYTGITTNVEQRLATHQAGNGAKNLKGKGPLLLIHQHSVGNKSAASKLEYQVKKLSRAKKEAYVASFKAS